MKARFINSSRHLLNYKKNREDHLAGFKEIAEYCCFIYFLFVLNRSHIINATGYQLLRMTTIRMGWMNKMDINWTFTIEPCLTFNDHLEWTRETVIKRMDQKWTLSDARQPWSLCGKIRRTQRLVRECFLNPMYLVREWSQ